MSHLRVRRAVTPVVVAAALAAWLGASPTAEPQGPSDAAAIRHVLNRLTFGPRPGDVARVQRLGLAVWIDDQLRAGLPDNPALRRRLAALPTLTLDSTRIAQDYVIPAREARRARLQAATAAPSAPPGGTAGASSAREPRQRAARATGQRLVIEELTTAKLLRAASSDRQLEEVLVDFWFNHFNVLASKGRTPIFITAYERDAIRPHVLGRFRDLLGATAKSPAMLFYLDNWLSTAPDAGPGRRARRLRDTGAATTSRAAGLNENYGRELLELHTLGVDAGYTQDDVVNVARAFTGWTIDPRTQGFRFAPALHDDGGKRVLGATLPPGGGIADGERVLDLLAAHPATARHVASKLARRFVSDTPPDELVARAAGRFLDTRGDLREVVRTIVTSPEFMAAAVSGQKLKTPFEFAASAVRALDAELRNARPLMRALEELGMPPYLCQPPTGYADTADAWTSSGALVSRMNLALELAHPAGRIVSAPRLGGSLVTLRTELLDEALGGAVASETLRVIERATSTQQMVALVLGSPEFQRR